MTDDGKIRTKHYIYMISFAAVAERSLNIYLYQKNSKLYEKSIKSLS